MKKTLIRSLALMLIVTLMTAGLAACGSETQDQNAGGSGSEGAESGQGWRPTKPYNAIVPFSAGGGTDQNVRVLSMFSEEYLGQSMAVINKGGAGGLLGYVEIANAEPDGSTLGIFAFPGAAQAALTENEFTLDKIKFLFAQVIEPKFIAVAQDSPFQTMQELIDYARAHPGELVAANNGAGSSNEIAMIALGIWGDMEFINLGFDGSGPMKVGVLGGHADLMPVGATELDEQLRPLMVFGQTRHPEYPDVPTSYELGIELDVTAHRLIGVPAGTPQEVIDYLMEGFTKMNEDPEYQEAMAKTDSETVFITGEELDQIVQEHLDFVEEYQAMMEE